MEKRKLLSLVGAFIRVADSDLVDNRKCFPCKKEDHIYYKEIRDIYKKIFDEANFTNSKSFLSEVEGKSEKFISLKIKLSSSSGKREQYREELLDILCDENKIEIAHDLINVEHQDLLSKAIDNLAKLK